MSDVLDCWFESGAMPYAQAHYPFERKAEFEAAFPGDFIVEYIAQTRGWFYTLVVLAAALFDDRPFKNAICHGVHPRRGRPQDVQAAARTIPIRWSWSRARLRCAAHGAAAVAGRARRRHALLGRTPSAMRCGGSRFRSGIASTTSRPTRDRRVRRPPAGCRRSRTTRSLSAVRDRSPAQRHSRS